MKKWIANKVNEMRSELTEQCHKCGKFVQQKYYENECCPECRLKHSKKELLRKFKVLAKEV